jgi:hypothetical protein
VRVFLTTDSASAAKALRGLLKDFGHDVLEPSQYGAGALAHATNFDAAVVGFFASKPNRTQSSAMFVETGIAVGRGVPVLVLTPFPTPIPALTGVPVIEASLEDRVMLRLKVSSFIQGAQSEAPRATPDLRALRRAASNPRPAINLEDRVRRLLEEAGELVSMEDLQPRSSRPDFAVWLTGSSQELGMVLVEVKAYQGEPLARRLREGTARLRDQVLAARASFGLLVYEATEQTKSINASNSPLTAAVSFEDFARAANDQRLDRYIWTLRNKGVHGIGGGDAI